MGTHRFRSQHSKGSLGWQTPAFGCDCRLETEFPSGMFEWPAIMQATALAPRSIRTIHVMISTAAVKLTGGPSCRSGSEWWHHRHHNARHGCVCVRWGVMCEVVSPPLPVSKDGELLCFTKCSMWSTSSCHTKGSTATRPHAPPPSLSRPPARRRRRHHSASTAKCSASSRSGACGSQPARSDGAPPPAPAQPRWPAPPPPPLTAHLPAQRHLMRAWNGAVVTAESP